MIIRKLLVQKIKLTLILLLLISLSTLIVRCQEKFDKSGAMIKIKINEDLLIKDTIHISSLINVKEIIPLETNKNCVIGEINKVILSMNRIFVFDFRRARGVFIFDRNGKFISIIKSFGKGPSDLFWPSDITFNYKTNELFVLDGGLKKFNTYNENGNYITTTTLGFFSDHFEILDNGDFVFSAEDKYCLYITDNRGAVKAKFIKFEPEFQSTQPKPLIRFEDQVYFQRFLDNTIYRITDNKPEPYLIIDYGNHTLTREAFLKFPVTNMDRTIDKKYMYGNYSFRITNSHYSFYFNYNGRGYYGQYNKESKHTLVISCTEIKDDLFNGGINLRSVSGNYQKLSLGIIEPHKMNPVKKLIVRQKPIDLSVNDNPLILLYDMK